MGAIVPNQFEEILRCQRDFVYFVENYIKVNHPKDGIIPFILHGYQKKLAKTFDDNRFVLVSKYRQGGFTTFAIIYNFWKCLFNSEKRFVCFCKTDGEAIHVGKIVDQIVSNLPDWLKPEFTTNNAHEKKIKATNSSMRFNCLQAACGMSITDMMIDEAAFIPNMEENWKAVYPCIAAYNDSKVQIISTQNKYGWFHEMCKRAKKGENKFHFFQSSYKESPYYKDKETLETMKRQIGVISFMQDVLCLPTGELNDKISDQEIRYKALDIFDRDLSDDDKVVLVEMIQRWIWASKAKPVWGKSGEWTLYKDKDD